MADDELDDLYFDAVSTGLTAKTVHDTCSMQNSDSAELIPKQTLPTTDQKPADQKGTGLSHDTPLSYNVESIESCDNTSADHGQTEGSCDRLVASNFVCESVISSGHDPITNDAELLTNELIKDLVQKLEVKAGKQVNQNKPANNENPPSAFEQGQMSVHEAISKFSSSSLVDEPVHCSIGDVRRINQTHKECANALLSVSVNDSECKTELLGENPTPSDVAGTNIRADLNNELTNVIMKRSKEESQVTAEQMTDELEQTEGIYSDVPNSDNRCSRSQDALDNSSVKVSESEFVLIDHPKQTISLPILPETDLKSVAELKDHTSEKIKSKTWKAESKKKSGTLKRTKKRNPFPGHQPFHSIKDGVVPELDDELGIVEMFHPFALSSDDSSPSFSDSSFDSCESDLSSDEEDDKTSISDKPLPAIPAKQGLRERINARLGQSPERAEEEESVILTVQPKRYRSPPRLPPAPDNRTKEQQKLEGVLKSLSESEISFINSLERLTKEYHEPIITTFGISKPEVRTAFKKVGEILNFHKMFEIELGVKLKDWYEEERIGSIFSHFSQRMVLDIYSEYVNSYGAASEHIKEVELSKPIFREFLMNKQMSSSDRLSIAGLMLKPIQRFPQFIMIVKDLLKYTPREHHDREPLQEALTGLENVAHQLNERKRQSEQYYHGEIILNKLSKLTPRVAASGRCFLIRQDDVEQLSQDPAGSHHVKCRRLFLMNDKLISVGVSLREQDGPSAERFTFKWNQNLRDLDLRTSAITPNMRTKVIGEIGNISIQTPVLDKMDENPYSIASDLNDMMHDVTVLGQISQLLATLKLSYSGLTEDGIQQHMVNLQKQIQGKDYQLQMLNSSSVILWDSVRSKKYIFSMASPQVKQEWCVDFLLSKSALEVINVPSWHSQDGDMTPDLGMPAYLMKHMSLDIQRQFTRVQCAVPVYFPTSNEGSVEHLWVCTSKESHGQVSIISLHTAKPGLVESFQATSCEIVCAEVVPGFALAASETAFEDDSVWMATVDSEILVFVLSERLDNKQSVSHRKAVHTFRPGYLIVKMAYVDDTVICGTKNGSVVIFCRDDDGVWNQGTMLILGIGEVTSIIAVRRAVWVACGPYIYILDLEQCKVKDKVSSQQDTAGVHVQHMVKAGVGVWASFIARPNICLYHAESHKLLQDFNISSAINEFINVYSGNKETSRDYTVTSLMASLGLLWVGTNIGIILTYPLPRLRDGVPRIKQRPHVALHGHNQPVMFLIPVHYGPVSGMPIRRRASSILGRTGSKKRTPVDLPTVTEGSITEGQGYPTDECIYETIEYGRNVPDENEYKELFQIQKGRDESSMDVSNACNKVKVEGKSVENDPRSSVQSTLSSVSSEHAYFILDKKETDNPDKKTVYIDMGNHGDETESSTYNKNIAEIASNSNQEDAIEKTSHYEAMTIQSQRPESPELSTEGHSGSNVEGQTGSKLLSRPRGKAMTFRSELAWKLQQRKSTEDLTDRVVNESEVERLYEDLLHTESKRSSSTSQTLGHSYRIPEYFHRDGEEGEMYYRPRSETPIFAKKPSTKFSFDLHRRSNAIVKHTSFKQETQTPKPDSNKISSSFSVGSGIDTLRKSDTNTMLVLSGGDGYRDWKKRHNITYRPDEACLLFWMYKF